MNNNNTTNDIKETLAKAVSFTVGNQRGKKSAGTKIGTRSMDIPIIKVQPFSK